MISFVSVNSNLIVKQIPGKVGHMPFSVTFHSEFSIWIKVKVKLSLS
jgi:hypothetical protein